jgi:holo-[acyl-carrier protein] synthase
MMMKRNKLPRIGVDLAKISRFENQEKLAKKILSTDEFKIYQSHPQPAVYLAGRFAGKEAFIKAYRTEPLPSLSAIEVLNEPDGAPTIQFAGKAYAISLSHDGEYVVAMVII